jgi:hypothetical protein
MLAFQYFSGAECDTDQYLVVANVRERFTETKEAAQKFELERFTLRNVYELEVRKQY